MSLPIRVLHVIGSMDRGGAETLVMNLYREIDRSKVQFDFVVHTKKKCSYDEEISNLGGKIHRLSKFRGPNILNYVQEWRSFFDKHPTYKVIHGHIGSSAAIYLNIAKNRGLYTIAHSHSAGAIQSFSDICWNILSYPTRHTAHCLFACSHLAGVKRFGRKYMDPRSERHIIQNAIKSEKFIFSEKKRGEMRKKYNLENFLVYGHVGRFTPAKNHFFLLSLFKELHKQNSCSKLLLVGDGELRKEIQTKIQELSLNNDVILTGAVDNVGEVMQAMDIFILPSIYEGLPTTAIEAQASGLPSILSDTITSEVKISPLVSFVSLNEPIETWVRTVKTAAQEPTRRNMQDFVVKSGYEVGHVAKWLEEFYLSKLYA